MAVSVVFFRTAAGAEPVRDWLKALPKEVRQTIGSDLLKAERMWPIGKPLVDGLGKGLWELRSTHNKAEYRVLFGIVGGELVALHGFQKKTQKTSKRDLTLGYDRLAEYRAGKKM